MTRVATPPFPALLLGPAGERIGPARLHLIDATDTSAARLRAFVIRPDGRDVMLALDVELTAPLEAPTRNSREITAHTAGGDWTLRKGGCACGSRRLLLTMNPETWTAEVVAE